VTNLTYSCYRCNSPVEDWWLEQENFQAAGKPFASDQAYLTELKRRGVNLEVAAVTGHHSLQ